MSTITNNNNNNNNNSSSTSSSETMTPHMKKKMEGSVLTSEKICRIARDNLYRKTNLGIYMSSDGGMNELRNFVIERFYENANFVPMTAPSRKALRFTTKDLFNNARATLERRGGTSTSGQCNNSIGGKNIEMKKPKPNDLWINSVRDGKDEIQKWETTHCWLCGMPLKTTKKIPDVDCEHKLAMLIMMLVGAGLKKTKQRGKNLTYENLIQDSNKKKEIIAKYFGKGSLRLHPDWKIFVRAEGYGWSHSYCNQYKSQIPFISLKYIPTVQKYEYVIEINNILQYLAGMFEIKDRDLDGIFKWYEGRPRIVKQEWKDQYMKAPSRMKIEWKNEMGFLHTGERQKYTNKGGTKKDLLKNAFTNIIDMLIPTYFLLNIGEDILPVVLNKAKEVFSNSTVTKKSGASGHDRSFVRRMEQFPIPLRLQDNISRILGWLTKGKEEELAKWISQIDPIVENPIITYLREVENEEGKKLQDQSAVLKLFEGNQLSVIREEEDDANDDLQDLVENSEMEELNKPPPRAKRGLIEYKTGMTPVKSKSKGNTSDEDGSMGGRKRTRRRRKNKKKRSKRKKKRKRTKKKRRRRKKITRKRKSK